MALAVHYSGQKPNYDKVSNYPSFDSVNYASNEVIDFRWLPSSWLIC